MEIRTSAITLSWYCDECGATASQPLEEVQHVGTITCNDCDYDMLMNEHVEVTEQEQGK